MWLNLAAKLVPGMIKTGMSIAANRRKTKELESVAELKMAERMAAGEVEFRKAVIDSHKGDWKDEFCLILISIPLLLLAWSVFSDDPNIQQKIDSKFFSFRHSPLMIIRKYESHIKIMILFIVQYIINLEYHINSFMYKFIIYAVSD